MYKGDVVSRSSVTVRSYAGYKGERTPRSIDIEGQTISVVEILDRWYTETHCCFRILGNDARRYVVRCDLEDDAWELVMQERQAGT